jgi:hypothetical protein
MVAVRRCDRTWVRKRSDTETLIYWRSGRSKTSPWGSLLYFERDDWFDDVVMHSEVMRFGCHRLSVSQIGCAINGSCKRV